MDKYRVRLYPKAFKDIDGIFAYIAENKQSMGNAQKQTNRIRKALKTLEVFPDSHQDRVEGAYAGKGYKQFLIDNYIAIYKIDEKKHIVNVVTVQYKGRNL
ncbi:MAG: type II toxin-antitoxin system RelE/ParE family toxin [Eubacteriaceae bacterium]|nr:type II toxin-antitoxin system RelE/ParE family toxin [Eubacteriaceae bacterium]